MKIRQLITSRARRKDAKKTQKNSSNLEQELTERTENGLRFLCFLLFKEMIAFDST